MKYLIIFSIFMLSGCEHVIMFDNVCRSDIPRVPEPERYPTEIKRPGVRKNTRAKDGP